MTSLSQETQDLPKWTSKVGTTQVTPARFMLERNMDPSFDNDQYLVLTQNEEEEGEDEVIRQCVGFRTKWKW